MRWITAFFIVGTLAAAPPDTPFNETPIDGATEVAAMPELCVDVTDPDGDSIDVTFRGRRLTGKPFTIVALPDTQYYSRDYPNIFTSQTQWIVDEHETRNIVFVTHLGDIVQNGGNTTQWNRANNSMSLLDDPGSTGLIDGIPFGLAPGNHDEAPIGNPRSGGNEGGTTAQYNQRFGVQRFAGREYYGDNYDFGDPGLYANNNDNNYELFTAGGMDFIIIHLEYDQVASAQRTAVLQWLDNVLMAHSERRAIIMTHFMISNFALFSNQGQAIYDQVKDNPNVFLMTGGHTTGGARRSDQYMGNSITSILSDFQGWAFGGNGYLRIMTFVPEENEIRVETYSPWIDQYDRSAAQDFTVVYPMRGPVPYESIGRVYGVPSGGTACVPWSGHREGVPYEWSVELSDADATTGGPSWRFTSDGACSFDTDCFDLDRCSIDVCEAGICPGSGVFDGDSDGICEDVDNCPRYFNVQQLDFDNDGLGDICDACPDVFDPAQYDSDGDGSPDGCDCQSIDGGDREPGTISGLIVNRIGATANLAWPPVTGADAYSITRGDLSLLAPEDLGGCLAEAVFEASFDDTDLPVPGDGFFYLVQGQNFDCELGSAGRGSDELLRKNLDPGACVGGAHFDDRAFSETNIYGDVTGSLADTLSSDDVHESITETLSSGNPDLRFSHLEHRWTISLSGGRRVELHVEGHRRNNVEGDDMLFEYSTDGGAVWIPAGLTSLPTADNGIDLVVTLPETIVGEILLRVIDADHSAGKFVLDWVAIDDLFVRSVP